MAGGASGAGAGRGGGRGRGAGARAASGGCGGLLVSRFDPLAAAAPASAPAPPRLAEEGRHDRGTRKRQKSPEAANGAKAWGEEVDVKPFFARVFKGGPKRKEALLPERPDEGLQEAPPAPEDAIGPAGGLSWLSSLGAREEEAIEPAASAVAEFDWMSSLGAARAGAAGAGPDGAGGEAVAAVHDAGQPLPDVPPFRRSRPLDQIEREFHRERRALLLRVRRVAKDARRTEQKRGQLRLRPRPR